MKLYQDGSTHEWGSSCQWDLIVTPYDATIETAVTNAANDLLRAIERTVGRVYDR
ncbi:MAG: hypothetical protein SGJ26_20140 [Nitrospirota bacterium]|nr:hypothetical protein [Nitrospirota bacterium]